MSGWVIHIKYGKQDRLSIRRFYYKRWKAMLPAYLLVWLFAYLMNVTQYGRFFYLEIPKSRLLLTFIGMDGYFSWMTTTYFITGEWFLGAILVAYMMYPVLRLAARRSPWMTLLAMVIVYEIRLNSAFFHLDRFLPLISAVAPATCLLSFYVGMMFAANADRLGHPAVVIGSSLILLIGLFVPVRGQGITKEIVVGCALLLILCRFGDWLCRSERINRIVGALSGLSYYTFLLHHMLIYRVLEKFDSANPYRAFLVFAAITCSTFAFSKALQIVMRSVLQGMLMKKVDRFMLGKA